MIGKLKFGNSRWCVCYAKSGGSQSCARVSHLAHRRQHNARQLVREAAYDGRDLAHALRICHRRPPKLHHHGHLRRRSSSGSPSLLLRKGLTKVRHKRAHVAALGARCDQHGHLSSGRAGTLHAPPPLPGLRLAGGDGPLRWCGRHMPAAVLLQPGRRSPGLPPCGGSGREQCVQECHRCRLVPTGVPAAAPRILGQLLTLSHWRCLSLSKFMGKTVS